MDVISKVCTKCEWIKPLSEFNNQKSGKHGKRASCRECQNAENRAYKQTDKGIELRRAWKRSDVGKENSKRYREKHSAVIKVRHRFLSMNYKERRIATRDNQRFGGNRSAALKRDEYKCVLCGSAELLQVHHKDEKGRNIPKEEQNHSLDNLITLCAKCHIIQHNPVLKRWGKR